jgi:chromosome partitioning protein
MRTLAIVNAKGGTGKTTLAVHLAAGLARRGQRTLLVDLDPQGNASAWLLGELAPGTLGAADAIPAGRLGAEHLHAVPGREGLSVLPSTPQLAGLDLALAQEVAGETLLRRALSGLRGFDAVIIDCPPSLGLSVLSALVASDAAVAPVLPSFLALAGLARLEEACSRIRERLNARTHVLGFVLFGSDAREGVTAETRDVLEAEGAGRLFRAEVRVSTAAKSLPARRLTAWDAGADARGAADYAAVLDETLARLEAGTTTRRRRKG